MYAIVRETTYDLAALAKGSEQLNEFQALHARQPGYEGTVVVEIEPGRWITVNLWDTGESAMAALPIMMPAIQRLLAPMLTGPSKMLGAGAVVRTDLHKG